MSKQFNKYLNKNYPNWQTMQKNAYEVLTKTDRRNKKAAGEWFDTLEDAIKKYGSSMHGKQKIIAEGVQILDETLFYKNKKYLKDKPLIIMETSYEDSILSRMVRDNKAIDKLLEPDRIEQGKQWLKDQNYLKKMILGGDKK